MQDRLFKILDFFSKRALLQTPIDEDAIKKAVTDTVSLIGSGVSSAKAKEVTLELAIELVEEDLAERIDDFWRPLSASNSRPLPNDSLNSLQEILLAFKARLNSEARRGPSFSRLRNGIELGATNSIPTNKIERALQLDDISFVTNHGSNRSATVLQNVDVSLEAGRLVALCGPNGSGKTTLLTIAAGIRAPSSGDVLMPNVDFAQDDGDSENLTPGQVTQTQSWAKRREHTFFLPASPPELESDPVTTLYEYAAAAGHGPKIRKISVSLTTSRYSLEALANRTWNQLSSGERLRIALACGSILRPKLMILDEPLAPLDERTRIRFLMDMYRLTRRQIRTTSILFSTHNAVDSERFSDEVLLISDRKVVSAGKHNQTFDGKLFRFGLKDPDVSLSVATLPGCRSVSLGGWLLVKAPETHQPSSLLQELEKRGLLVVSYEDLSASAIREQLEVLFESAD